MKITLSDTPLLSTQQIGELASTMDLLHKRTLAAIERLNQRVQKPCRWCPTTTRSASVSTDTLVMVATGSPNSIRTCGESPIPVSRWRPSSRIASRSAFCWPRATASAPIA